MFQVPQKFFLDHKTQNWKFSSGGVVTLLKSQPGGGKFDMYNFFYIITFLILKNVEIMKKIFFAVFVKNNVTLPRKTFERCFKMFELSQKIFLDLKTQK